MRRFDATRAMGWTAAVLLVLPAACGEEPADPGPAAGWDPGLELVLVEVRPDPSDASYEWLRAVKVGDLPKLNVGQPSADFLRAARRPAADPDLLCLGADGSIGCDVVAGDRSPVMGINFGGPTLRAYALLLTVDDVATVGLWDRAGTLVGWQRPVADTVVFRSRSTVAPSPVHASSERSMARAARSSPARCDAGGRCRPIIPDRLHREPTRGRALPRMGVWRGSEKNLREGRTDVRFCHTPPVDS